MATIPRKDSGERVIETARLVLRRMRRTDEDALLAVLGDPVAMQYYPAAYSREEVRRWIKRWGASYAEHGYGLYAMALKSTGEVIGDCGHAKQDVEGETEIEIGYHVLRALQGQGYATEAARACVKYGFETLGARKLISLIRPENMASRRVAEKMGMRFEKEIIRKGFATLVYSLRLPD
jgi:ribosomal-protein-alanine N-acetyltransferase